MQKEIPLIKDKYSRARGGASTLYDLMCAACESPLLTYQKDGVGNFMRCYTDRIRTVEKVKGVEAETMERDLSKAKALRCDGCDNLIATSMIYEKENRPAFRLVRGSFSRKPHQSDPSK